MYCEKCGDIKTLMFDGYSINDRAFEQMMFLFEVSDKMKPLNVRVKPEDQNYFDDFATKKWLKEAKEYAQNQLDTAKDDIAASDLQCAMCGGRDAELFLTIEQCDEWKLTDEYKQVVKYRKDSHRRAWRALTVAVQLDEMGNRIE